MPQAWKGVRRAAAHARRRKVQVVEGRGRETYGRFM